MYYLKAWGRNEICPEKCWKTILRIWNVLKYYFLLYLVLAIGKEISIQMFCLHLVNKMLHKIKAKHLYTIAYRHFLSCQAFEKNFLPLIQMLNGKNMDPDLTADLYIR